MKTEKIMLTIERGMYSNAVMLYTPLGRGRVGRTRNMYFVQCN